MIERRDNPGFGAACNVGLDHVTQPVTVLLNPDTEDIRGDVAAARRAGDATATCTRRGSAPTQRSVHPLPGTWGAFLPALLPVHPVRAEPFRATRPRTVGWAIAACLAARTELIRFDERIFMWAEDMDLCLRARNQGVRTVFHPDLEVRHTGPPQRRARAVRGARAQPPRGDRAQPRATQRDGATTRLKR